MKNFFKPVVTCIFILFYFIKSNGQVTADIKDTIIQKFLNYCDEVPRQEIYVHSDRLNYIAGEDMWFNIYLFNRKTNSLQTDEKIAYIEVLNPENQPVVQKRILLEKGIGQGQFSLPDSLSTGTYILRAYTSWMKNFMPENCFMEEIKIHNAFRNKTFQNKSYFSESTVNKLTDPVSEALSIDVNNMTPGNLDIVVTTNSSFRSQNSGLFYVFIQTHGNIDHFASEKALSEKTVLSIPKNKLTPGINHITVFNADGQPLAERLIFTSDKTDRKISLNASSTFKTRGKIALDLEFPEDEIKEYQNTNLSVSVVPENPGENKISLVDYMLFGSEYGNGPLRFLKTGPLSGMSDSKIDSLLMTLKSNWIDWNKILSGEIKQMKYEHETEFHNLSGNLMKKNQLPADSGRNVFMSVPGKVAQFQYAVTDSESDFNMKVSIDDRVKDFVIQPGDPDNISTTRIESSFSDKFIPSVTLNEKEPVSDQPSFISRMSTNYQVNKIYGSTSLGPPVNQAYISETRSTQFYGKPDIGLIMDDYIKLPVMEEVFFELIPGVGLKNKKSGYEVLIFDPIIKSIYEVPPCLMIDGVVIYDASIIAGLDPELVERIDIILDRYHVGDCLFYGIINVITRSGDFGSVKLPEYATRLQYKVYELPLTFTAPDYSSLDKQLSRVPDFRNTLYWNPSVKTGKARKSVIEFWSGDIKSKYVVDIQGVTSDGRMISYKSVISIE